MQDIPYTDAHTHRRYKNQDVQFIRNAFLHPNTNHLGYPVCMGLHPWLVDMNFDKKILELKQLAKQTQVAAIGECGLDYAVSISRDLQREAFIAQLQLAQTIKKPVVLHIVKALHELPPILKQFQVNVILHSFQGNIEQAKQLLLYPVFFSLGPQLLNKPKLLRDLVQTIPVNRLLFETDIYNINIQELYRKAAQEMNCDIAMLRKEVFTTFGRLFFPNAS